MVSEEAVKEMFFTQVGRFDMAVETHSKLSEVAKALGYEDNDKREMKDLITIGDLSESVEEMRRVVEEIMSRSNKLIDYIAV